jgi:hypothetical protein
VASGHARRQQARDGPQLATPDGGRDQQHGQDDPRETYDTVSLDVHLSRCMPTMLNES